MRDRKLYEILKKMWLPCKKGSCRFHCARGDLTAHLSVVALVLLIMTPVTGFSHSLYIQAGRHQVETGKSSLLFFCFGHHVPVDDALRRKKLKYVRVIAPDQTMTEVTLRDEKSLHSYLIKYEQVGTYALVAETIPGYFAMYTDKKGRKRHSLKPLHTFIHNASEVETSMRSSQWVKTYVVSGEPSIPFPGEVGMPMELVPLKDVFTLQKGDTLEIQVFNEGKPFTGEGFWDATYNGFSTESEDLYLPSTQVKGGKFVVPIDASGRWYVRYFTKTDAPEEKRGEYLTEKRTATLVFEVRNKRKRPKVEK